jgi:arginyl-tRNA synthetase
MLLAKPLKSPPSAIAEKLLAEFNPPDFVEKVEIAPPGFINITIKRAAKCAVAADILRTGENYGAGGAKREKILVEFVSVNPTGPLHTGHARGAAYGASLADILQFAGYSVAREYYVNDAGRQMDILALSLWLRYLGVSKMPAGTYRGEYLSPIAAKLKEECGARFVRDFAAADFAADKEEDLDGIIKTARAKLGDDDYRRIRDFGEQEILRDIREDLAAFGVGFDVWFSEKSLFAEDKIQSALADFDKKNLTYQKDGALWFRAADFGDEKDRVVRRENGEYTYFASDIAYHKDKLARGFDILMNIFGADHHGYAPRLAAIVSALGGKPANLEVRLMQLATLSRAGKPVKMSTRAGEFVTLRALREEIGTDAARYFFISRRPEQRLEFDLELAKSRSADNPVFYIQYAHARACALARKGGVGGEEQQKELAEAMKPASLKRAAEAAIADDLGDFGDIIAAAAAARAPHLLARYLLDLAVKFHGWYASAPILTAPLPQKNARLALALACRVVIKRGLSLLGVSAPETM